jgi:hypothetical protein
VSFRYTVPARLCPPPVDSVLMETPYEEVLAALVLDTKLNLRFIRTGSRAEGARTALLRLPDDMLAPGRHWSVTLTWDADELSVALS